MTIELHPNPNDGSYSELLVLSTMLTSAEAIDIVRPILKGSEFNVHEHEVIYDAIIELAAAGLPVDPGSVADHLGPAGLARINGASTLYGITFDGKGTLNKIATREDAFVSSVDYHADKIRQAAKSREVVRTAVKMQQSVTQGWDPDDVVSTSLDAITQLVDTPEAGSGMRDLAFRAMESLDAPVGIPTPWHALNDAIGGWRKGMLYVLGARPAIGKSILGMQAALDAARRAKGETSLLFSLEMPAVEMWLRLATSVGSVDNVQITRHNVGNDDYHRLGDASASLQSLPLFIVEGSARSLGDLRGEIRTQKRHRPVGLVVVDYLNLIRPPVEAGKNDRRVQVDAIAQGLKNLAYDEDVPVVALAQLNRSIEARADKMPVLSDLRESGGIEAAADVVALMHRVTNPEQGDVTDLAIWLAKNRQGPQTTFHLLFEGQFSRATDRPWAPPFGNGTLDDVPPDTRYSKD